MRELIDACRYALRHNLGFKHGERALVVTDENKIQVGNAFLTAARELSPASHLIQIPVARFNGEEPPEWAAEEMLKTDVLLLPVTKSLSWTHARMAATQAGARIASMAGGLDESMIVRLFRIDYRPIRTRVNRIADLMDKAEQIRISTASGTDLFLDVQGRKGRGRKGGIYTEPGDWGNLPCGEAFVAPVEGTARGVYRVDASQAAVGAVRQPIRISVDRGVTTKIEGGPEADILRNHLLEVKDEAAFNIAEFGIGCNDKAILSGATIEDEKVLGTCHIALGNNIHFGGQVDVGVHVDGIIKNPTIEMDDRTIMAAGTLILS